MKRKCLILAILGLILFSVGCQEQVLVEDVSKGASEPAKAEKKAATPQNPDAKVVEASKESKAKVEETVSPPPQITFEKLVHDFGVVDPGSKNTCELKFTNTGKGVLNVKKRIKSSCGCTVPLLKKENYAPDESGVINVTYTAGKDPGAKTRRLTVHSNDKKNPKVQLTIKANVELQVKHEPKTLKLLLKSENAGSPEITIYSVDGKAFSIKSFKSTGDSITADFDPSERKTKFVIQPKVDVQKLKKRLNGSVQISLDHPRCDSVRIPFKALPAYKITPSSSLVVMNSEPGKAVNREIWILHNYGEDFEIESLSSKNGIVNVLEKKKEGDKYKLDLEVVPPPVEGKKRIFTDELLVKIKDGDTLKIICRGFYTRNKKARGAK